MGRRKARGNQEGSIFWHKGRKRWIVVLTLPDGSRSWRTTDLPADAGVRQQRDTLATVLAQINDEGELPAPDITVKAWVERYLEDADTEETTKVRRRRYLRRHIAPTIGNVRLDKLTAAQVRGMVNTLQRRDPPLAPRTVGEVRSFLSGALKAAVRSNLIPRNVAEQVRLPKAPKRDYPLLTEQQFRELLAALDARPRNAAAFVLALTTGLRVGEILGLTWDDLDLERGRLVIMRSASSEAPGKLTRGKSSASRRPIPLPEIAIAALRRQREQLPAFRERYRDRWVEKNLVFPNRRGDVAEANHSIRGPLKTTLKQLGLPEMRTHDLRHNYASHLLAQGVPIQVVSEMLGHASVNVTWAIYAHLLESQRGAATAAMNRFLGSTVSSTVSSPPADQQSAEAC